MIAVKGMSMPKKCEECYFLCLHGNNYVCDITSGIKKNLDRHPEWCPLVEVPDEVFGKAEQLSDNEQHSTHGVWLQIAPHFYRCTVCGQVILSEDISANKYCSYCGAKMEV